jgi:hypothetical protein
MKKTTTFLGLAALFATFSGVNAATLPPTIVVQDRAVVPVVKTEIIRTMTGQAPVREVNATVLEVTNKGKDVVAHDIVFNDNQATFSDTPMSTPVLKKGGVIVPTSTVSVNSKITQGQEVIAESKTLDAQGVEFKKGEEPAQRSLQLGQISDPNSQSSATRAVISKNGEVTRDAVVIQENE